MPERRGLRVPLSDTVTVPECTLIFRHVKVCQTIMSNCALDLTCDSAAGICTIKSEKEWTLSEFIVDLNPMINNSSIDLSQAPSPDVSPAENINEKQQFDPCAKTTIHATSTSVCPEDIDPHHHNLSTLRLLFAHIGYINFYLLRPYLMAYLQCYFNSIPCNH